MGDEHAVVARLASLNVRHVQRAHVGNGGNVSAVLSDALVEFVWMKRTEQARTVSGNKA